MALDEKSEEPGKTKDSVFTEESTGLSGEPKSLSDEALIKIAEDLYHNKIFSSAHLDWGQDARLMGMIFMPLILADKKSLEWMAEHTGLVYEYYDKAGPRSIDGYLIFLSMRFIPKKDIERFNEIYLKYQSNLRK